MPMKQTTIKVSGKDYLLQHPGARWYAKHNDNSTMKNGQLSTEKYIDGLLENVVIEPKVKFEDFDTDMGALEEIITKIEGFLRGSN